LSPLVGRDLRRLRRAARGNRIHLAQALEAQYLAGEDESVARRELFDEPFLDLAQHAPAPERAALADTLAAEPYLNHRRLDDGADIEPVLLRHLRIRNAPQTFGRLSQLGVALICLERITAGRDEFDHLVEGLTRQPRISRHAGDFGIEIAGVEGFRAGHAEH